MEAVYLAWCHNMSMDLKFMEEPSLLACFEMKLAAEESAKAQVQQAVSKGKISEVDPIEVMEVKVPPKASKTPEA